MKTLEGFAWDHFGDQMDALYERRAVLAQRAREIACFLFDHKVRYEGPNIWDWDGEGHAYCQRCEGDGPNERAYESGYMETLPQRFWLLCGWILERVGYYRYLESKEQTK